jgi:DNA repair photolyase
MALRVIYEPRGKAGEYADLACNLYAGCDHGCVYCYAPAISRKSLETFTHAAPRSGVIDKIRRDAKDLAQAKDPRSILFCFMCDPYQTIDVEHQLTRQALEILLPHGLNVTLLTKGGKRSERDFDLIRQYPEQVTYATTLTLIDEHQRQQYEPGAAPTAERIAALEKAHDLGVKTWVSLEPVIDPDQSLALIQQTHPFVDLYKVGVLNYLPEAKAIDWIKFGTDAIALLESLNKSYYIKNDLKRYLSQSNKTPRL